MSILRAIPRMPTHLAIRLSALLCVLLAANTYGFVELYRYHLRYGLAPKMGEALSEGVSIIRASDDVLTDSQRLQWLQKVNSGSSERVWIRPSSADGDRAPLNQFQTLLESSMRHYAGDDVRIQPDIHRNFLLVDFINNDRPYRFSVPGSALGADDIWPFVWLIASNLVIVWGSVAFAAWQINRPLLRSAQALERSSNRLAEIELPSSAPREFQVFAARFNELARRLALQENERALLLASVSHDLRAPLTRIRLRGELIEDSKGGEGAGIVLDAESMRHIIDQFLDYQRGIVESRRVHIDLGLVVRELVERHVEIGRDLRLTDNQPLLMHVDPSAIDRVLNNLIDNACNHGAEPIDVSLRRDGDCAVLEVRDRGPGISQHEMNRLLQPFETLNKSRTRRTSCGLGLSIVDRIVCELNGELRLSNHTEGGLCVMVRLPISKQTYLNK